MVASVAGGRRRWALRWMHWSPRCTAVEQRRPGVLPNSRSRVAGLGEPGLRPGMREGRRVEPTVSRGIAACRGVAAEEQLGGGEARLRSAAKQGRRKMAAAGQVGGGASGTSSWLILRRLGHAVPVGNRGRRRLGRARCRRASREEEGRLARDLK